MEGGSSEGCLKWGGVIKGSFEKHLKTGGGGFKGVTTPCPPILVTHPYLECTYNERYKASHNFPFT